jgi:hypothetical protein
VGQTFVTGSLQGVLNGTFTSKSIGPAPSNTDAVLQVTSTAVGAVPAVYVGSASAINPNAVVFSNVQFPTVGFTFQISNIRVNASQLPNPSIVTEYVNIQYDSVQSNTQSANLISAPLTVGYIQTSLTSKLKVLNGSTTQTSNSYLTCIGNPLTLGPAFNTLAINSIAEATGVSATNTSFELDVTEVVPGAFKVLYDYPLGTGGVASENGSYAPLGGNLGIASSATQIAVTLGNVPASATVYFPFSVTVAGTTLTLANVSALTSPATVAGLNVFAYTPTNGAITATYVVTAAAVSTSLTFPIQVEMTFPANVAAPQGPVTVTAAYAPAAATLAGPASAVPTFVVSSATPFNASTISSCLTTLMFPYVTNYQGTYETGIAISNTTTDNLGATGKSLSTPIPGTCTLWFYGNAASPKSVTFPPTGTIGAFSASPAQNPTYADTLSDLIGAASTYNGGVGFTGYAIAQCTFPEAHGFAFVTDYTPGGNNTFAQGYLAVVIPDGRGEKLGTGE